MAIRKLTLSLSLVFVLTLFCFVNLWLLKLQAIEVISLVSYILLSWLLGITFYPLVALAFPDFKAPAYALSKVLGVGFFFMILWILHHFDFLLGPWTSSLLLLIVIFTFFKYSQEHFSRLILDHFKEIRIIELLFIGVFLLTLGVYALHPELYWGEKPMDFNLLNYFTRFPSLPPEDPWFFGERMHYYYWGYFYLANLGAMAGLSSEVSYAAGLALSCSLLCCALYSIFSQFFSRLVHRALASFFIVSSANIAAFIGFFSHDILNMSYFWSSTRVFSRSAFAEYPSWSFLFADLHAHVLSYPFALSFLSILLFGFNNIWKEVHFSKHRFFLFIHSLSYALLLLVNGWDFVIYSLLAVFLWVYFSKGSLYKRNYWLLFFIVHLFGLMMASPLFLTLLGGVSKKLSVSTEGFNGAYSILLFLGGWLTVIGMCSPLLLRSLKNRKKSPMVALFMGSVFIYLLAENLIFMDRINTIFKSFTNIYIWLGVVALSLFFNIFELSEEMKKKVTTRMALAISALILSGQIVAHFFNTYAVTSSRPYGKLSFGLNGGNYLSRFNKQEYAVIRFLKEKTYGLPRILERDANSFDHRATKVSMHTGLPSYLGWYNHVRLRGASDLEIHKRRSVVGFIYNATDPLKVYEKLMEIGIDFLVLTNVERRGLSREAIAKFEQYKDLFKPLVRVDEKTVLFGIGDYQAHLRSGNIALKEGNE